MKANLARFTWAVAMLASMALTTGAGIRWGAGARTILEMIGLE